MNKIQRNRGAKHAFRRDDRGAIVVLVAILIVPLILFAGLAIDLGQAYYARSVASSALDNAVLSAAMLDTDDHAVLTKEVQDFYAASLPSNFIGSKAVPAVTFVGDENSAIRATVSTTVNTTFMKLAGKNTVSVATAAQAERGTANTPMELILVLDNSSSMASGGRMAAMQAAANSLVDIVFGSKETADKLFVGIAPYTTTINVISMPTHEDWIRTGGSNQGINVVNDPRLFPPNDPWAGCLQERVKSTGLGSGWDPKSSLNDDLPNPGSATVINFEVYFNPSTWIHGYPYKDSDNHNVDIAPPWNPTWNTAGLKGDNDWKIDGSGNGVAAYAGRQFGERFTGNTNVGPNLGCPVPLLPMTSSKAVVKAGIANQKVTYRGGTFGHSGLVWGWRLLSPKWSGLLPDAAGTNLPQAYTATKKVIVMMTGGDNHWEDWNLGLPGLPHVTLAQIQALYASNPKPKQKDVDEINSDGDYTGYRRLEEDRIDASGADTTTVLNDLMATVCTRIKNAAVDAGATADDAIIIYTVTFGGLSAATKQLYSDCASKNKNGKALYFDAPTDDDLKTLFEDIAHQLRNVRLSWPGTP